MKRYLLGLEWGGERNRSEDDGDGSKMEPVNSDFG